MNILEQAEAERKVAEEKAKQLGEFIDAQKKADALKAILFPLSQSPQMESAEPSQAVAGIVPIINAVPTTPIINAIPTDYIVESKHQKDKIASIARKHLTQYTSLHTPKIVELCEADGLEFKAKNKVVAVSQALGKSDDFKPSRSNGWSLIKKDESSEQKSENVTTGHSDVLDL